MAVSKLYSQIGRLGSELAQTHYATTTDLDGVLPWLPTDADRQKLVELLGGRQPTLEEGREFEAGYRESMHRLDGNANDVRLNPLMLRGLLAALSQYGGVYVPPDGSAERLHAEVIVARAVSALREATQKLIPAPPPAEESPDAPEPAAALEGA